MSGFTLVIAIWGAGLSTALVLYKILIEDRRSVKVKLEGGVIYYQGAGIQKTTYTLQVNFYVKGKRPITITSYGIQLPNGDHIPKYHLEQNVDLRKTYSDGQGDNFIGSRESIESTIRDRGFTGKVKIRGYVEDISGKRHLSRKYKIDI